MSTEESILIKSRQHRKYPINENAFSTLTEESLYWLGFLYADGSIVEDKRSGLHTLSIGLAERDRGHIEKFKTFIKTTKPLQTRTRRNVTASWLAINCYQITKDLHNFGLYKKSLNRVAFPEFIESRDFWRGLIDGDGSLMTPDNEIGRLTLVGNKTIVGQFTDFAKTIVPNLEISIRPTSSIYRCQLAGKNCLPVVNVLYKNATTYLDRKMAKYKEILENSYYYPEFYD